MKDCFRTNVSGCFTFQLSVPNKPATEYNSTTFAKSSSWGWMRKNDTLAQQSGGRRKLLVWLFLKIKMSEH